MYLVEDISDDELPLILLDLDRDLSSGWEKTAHQCLLNCGKKNLDSWEILHKNSRATLTEKIKFLNKYPLRIIGEYTRDTHPEYFL